MSAQRANLLFDSISRNTGDIAIGLASAQLLNERGVASQVVDPFSSTRPRPLIVGGGDLIRGRGDSFYDAFRRSGANILNAAGVWSNADELGYLSEYAFVSARSNREVEYLRKWVPTAEVVPCATTLLRSNHFTIPGLEPGEPVVGIQLVPHSLRLIEDLIPIIDAIPYRKVFIPFTHYNADASFMNSLPLDRSDCIFLDHLGPRELHSVVAQMSWIVASSLHISIFAFSQNVPFVSIHQEKILNYFQDRGLAEQVVATGIGLKDMLERLNSETFDFSAEIGADRVSIESAFDRYVKILADADCGENPQSPSVNIDTGRQILVESQSAEVLADRDITLGMIEGRRMDARANEMQVTSELEAANRKVRELTNEIDDVQLKVAILHSSWNQRVARFLRHPIRTLRNRIITRRMR